MVSTSGRVVVLLLLVALAKAADYYEVLGVSRSATTGDIKRAYRELAMIHHPDKNPTDRQAAQEKFLLISEAYEVLRDPEKKAAYDQGPEGMDFEPNFSFDMAQQIFEQILREGGSPFAFSGFGFGGGEPVFARQMDGDGGDAFFMHSGMGMGMGMGMDGGGGGEGGFPPDMFFMQHDASADGEPHQFPPGAGFANTPPGDHFGDGGDGGAADDSGFFMDMGGMGGEQAPPGYRFMRVPAGSAPGPDGEFEMRLEPDGNGGFQWTQAAHTHDPRFGFFQPEADGTDPSSAERQFFGDGDDATPGGDHSAGDHYQHHEQHHEQHYQQHGQYDHYSEHHHDSEHQLHNDGSSIPTDELYNDGSSIPTDQELYNDGSSIPTDEELHQWSNDGSGVPVEEPADPNGPPEPEFPGGTYAPPGLRYADEDMEHAYATGDPDVDHSRFVRTQHVHDDL